MRATLSVMGMINYYPTLFSGINLPDGVDKDTLVNNIVTELAELELLYSSATFMETMIAIWSLKELPTWERVYKASVAEYNPIENYNRTETWSDTGEGNSTGSNSETVIGKVAGFNAADFQNRDYNDSTAGNQSQSNVSSQHTGTMKGNIGVTTNQSMLQQEIAIAPKLNIYDYITKSFKNRFCLLVY